MFLFSALALGVSADGLHGGSHGGRRGGRAGGRAAPRRRGGRQEAPPPLDNYGAGGALDSYAAGDAGLDTYAGGASDPALDMLQSSIPGIPGEDYPIYAEAPETGFSCEGQVDGGYYADPEAECQVFHICTADGLGGLGKYSFLCPNGTIFNQNYFICDWWFNFDCAEAENLYSRNDEIAAERAAADAAGDLGSYGAPADVAPASYDAPAAYDAPAPAGRAARNGRQRNGRQGGSRRRG